ncbi:MAG: hypothetical protein ACI85O_003648 [Saprospiraceae bacterium]|jgi:hypothetical protein
MREIKTEIIINANPEKIWKVLTDNAAYSSWNPFIVSMEGTLTKGNIIKNTMISKGKKQVFKPIILAFEENEKLEWLGRLPLGMFNGQHYFILEKVKENQTKFIHGENFSGWLRGLIMSQIGEDTRANFVKMNVALKARVEN